MTLRYSDKVIEHFTNPRNVGVIEDADGVGRVGNPVCGDMMEMTIKIEGDRIKDVRFRTFGCGAAIATSSMATELIKGKTIDEALKLTNRAIAEALDGLPPIKMHCSVLAADALKAALADYYRRQGNEARAEEILGEKPPVPLETTPPAQPLRWDNPDAIAEALNRAYPQENPLDLSLVKVFKRILALPGFEDDPDRADEHLLETIQMRWHELRGE